MNTAARPCEAELLLNLQDVELSGVGKFSVASLDSGQPLPYSLKGGRLQVKLTLAPHDIDAVMIQPGK